MISRASGGRQTHRRLAFTILLVGLFDPIVVRPGIVPTVVVIANPGVKVSEISADDLRSVFLGTKTSLGDDSYVKPVLDKAGPVYSTFLKKYLGKTDFALQTYYRSLVFSGKWSMPPILSSDADVVAYVGKTHGAIGYVDASAAIQGVKTLKVR